jgi:glycosyltransferase involved in cell wall biosynthesis
MKITLLVSDMSQNCLGRAYVLGKVLSKRYDVDILGPMFGPEIWSPVDMSELNYRAIPARGFPSFFRSAGSILDEIDGEVVYALKPLLGSFGLSLAAKHHARKPIVLDIDDWELGFAWWNISNQFLKTVASFYSPHWPGWTILLDKLTGMANAVTVSCQFLADRYGGHLVPHVRDIHFLDPSKYDGSHLRRKLGLHNKKVVLFLGTPRPYKGIEDLVEAVQLTQDMDMVVLLVGARHGDPFTQYLADKAEGVLHLIGTRPLSERPLWLSVADMVVLPQRDSLATRGQVPAKIFDAMAMAKPIIATAVSDIPHILEGCGILVPPNDTGALADQIQYLFAHPGEAAELGVNARQVCVQRYSFEAVEITLFEVFSKFE